MAVGNFSTANQTYRMLMGNGLLYTVPRFQRDYSWTEEEWDDLWHDTVHVLAPTGEGAHYMGYVVLQSRDNKNFEVIDGQQRIATLSIVVLAVLRNLQQLASQQQAQQPDEAANNQKRQEQLRNSFIGYLDPVTLIPRVKLTLNRNNDAFYRNYLVPLRPLPRRGLKATEHQLRKAFEWWDRRINSRYKSGEDLARFVDQLADRLFFTVITVSDELNAYKVFETLNARGVKLSATDLLKNYFFQVVHGATADEPELRALEELWEELVGKLGNDNFPEFVRTFWNSRYAFLRSTELFKRIREQVRDRQRVFELIREMQTDVDTYVALANPEDELWTPAQRPHVAELRMFNVRQAYPLLLAGFRHLDEATWTTLLRVVSIISFRYNIIASLPTNEQESVYTTTARQLHGGGATAWSDVLRSLRNLYPTDDTFRQAFATKVLRTTQSRNQRIVRYLLFKIEKQCSGQDFDFDSATYNLEHVLPQRMPSEGWDSVPESEHTALVYRLGNMTLLSKKDNRAAEQQKFAQKKGIYDQSVFAITRRIAQEHDDWNAEQLGRHQRWLANQAVGIWKVSQLDA